MLERAAQAELICCLVAILCVLAGSVSLIAGRKHPLRDAAAMALAVLAIAMLRGAVTEFSLVHINFHAAEILDEVYAHPWQSTRTYGVFHSLFYGAVMRSSGASFSGVAWANEIVAAITLLLMAFLGARYASSPSAFTLVVGLGLMHPVLLRLAGSEEGHNLAVLLSFIAFAALEAYRTTPRRALLMISAAALVLMVSTKGIMLVSIPCVAAIGLVRALPEQRRAVLWSLLPVIPVTVLLRMPDWAQQQGVYRMSQRLTLDSAMVALHTHPLLDPRGPVLLIAPLLIVGMVALLRRSWETRVVVASLAFLFASSYLLFEGQAVVFTFRLPVLTLAIVVAGIGAATVIDRARERWAGSRGPELAAAALLAALTVLAPGFDIVRTASAHTHEYEFIKSVTDRLPRDFTLIRLREGIPHPSYAFPHHLLDRAGISASVAIYPAALDAPDTGRPRVLLAGLECWGYSSLELTTPPTPPSWRTVTYGPTYGEFLRIPGAEVPAGERPECQEVRRRGARVVAARDVSTPSYADAPFVYYASDTTRLEFLILP